jgi:hypothetical protein
MQLCHISPAPNAFESVGPLSAGEKFSRSLTQLPQKLKLLRFTALGGAPQLLVFSFYPMLECTESTGV